MNSDQTDASPPLEQRAGGLASLFARNRAWADRKTGSDPGFFSRLVGQQKPRYFWIGCSDSRVPATEIVDLDPGEMFVHRNVANLTHANDPSFAAALQFAVDVLRVEHIMVVGHYGCGGIRAAMAEETSDAIGQWLAPIRQLNRTLITHHESGRPNANKLCEYNVAAQIHALSTNPVVRAAWKRQAPLTLHGWVYSIADGLLQTVCDPMENPHLGTSPVSSIDE